MSYVVKKFLEEKEGLLLPCAVLKEPGFGVDPEKFYDFLMEAADLAEQGFRFGVVDGQIEVVKDLSDVSLTDFADLSFRDGKKEIENVSVTSGCGGVEELGEREGHAYLSAVREEHKGLVYQSLLGEPLVSDFMSVSVGRMVCTSELETLAVRVACGGLVVERFAEKPGQIRFDVFMRSAADTGEFAGFFDNQRMLGRYDGEMVFKSPGVHAGADEGFCYLRLFPFQEWKTMRFACKVYPTLRKLRSYREKMLSSSELSKVRLKVAGKYAHVCAVDSLERSGVAGASYSFKELLAIVGLPGGETCLDLMVGGTCDPRVVSWHVASPYYGRAYEVLAGIDEELSEALVEGHSCTGESCVVLWFRKHLGGDLLHGRKDLSGLWTHPAFVAAVSGSLGEQRVVVHKSSSTGNVHVFGGTGLFDRSIPGKLWVGRLKSITESWVVQAEHWVDIPVCGDSIGGFVMPGVVPDGKRKRVLCDRCGFAVNPNGHAQRCVPLSAMFPREDVVGGAGLDWLGDALHMLDVRRGLLQLNLPVSLLAGRLEGYVSGAAQASYAEKECGWTGTRKVLSTKFESSYRGAFRYKYLMWFWGQLGYKPALRAVLEGSAEADTSFVGSLKEYLSKNSVYEESCVGLRSALCMSVLEADMAPYDTYTSLIVLEEPVIDAVD